MTVLLGNLESHMYGQDRMHAQKRSDKTLGFHSLLPGLWAQSKQKVTAKAEL